jgi:predicted RNA-binding Zn ribbon-like protein
MIYGPTPRGFTLALDLNNTGRAPERGGVDALVTPAALRSWLAERQLGGRASETLRTSPADAATLLAEACRLREAVTRAVLAFQTGAAVPAESLFGIDRVLASSRWVRRVEASAGGPRLREEEDAKVPLAILAPVALGAVELLTTADPGRIRQCASPLCAQWFVDTSKGGRRRWCSMERCGNRAKAARHRRRRKAG